MVTTIRTPFRPAYQDFLPYIRYATFKGLKWSITSTHFDDRDIVFDLGGIWNGS